MSMSHSLCVLYRAESGVACSQGKFGLSWAIWVVASLGAWMYLIVLQNAPRGWSREQGHCLIFFFLLLLPLFASGTQLPHLTFSIWPLPRGEIARVSKRGRHTSWILLSFNLHSPFSPWWCTWIRNEDIAQLRGFLRLLLRYCSYFCAMPRFWCIMDMDIGFITFVWCFDISVAQKRNSSVPATGTCSCHIQEIKSRGGNLSVFHCRHKNNFHVCTKIPFCLFQFH